MNLFSFTVHVAAFKEEKNTENIEHSPKENLTV